jgi:hypothetical protein
VIISKIFNLGKGRRNPVRDRTLCELHREIYDICVLNLYKNDPELMMEIVKMLEDAFIMGVKMNDKLIKYKLGSSSKWEKKHFNNHDKTTKKEVYKRRRERRRLEKLLKNNADILEKFDKKE